MGVFRIEFSLRSPLQIGAGSLGMIERTHLFVPGRVVWGALTDTLIRMHFPSPRPAYYEEAGTELRRGRFSTFFPHLPAADGRIYRMLPCIPLHAFLAEEKPEMMLDRDDAEALLCMSSASTAINPARMSAGAGTLHSTDLIRPVWSMDAEGRQQHRTVFSGYLELPERIQAGGAEISLDAACLNRCFSRMRIGGGRRNGWGVIAPGRVESVAEYGGFESIPWNGGRLLTAEQRISTDGHAVRGRASLVSYREYDSVRGSGQRFAPAAIRWQIGSVIDD